MSVEPDQPFVEAVPPGPLTDLDGVFDILPMPDPVLPVEPRLGLGLRLWRVLNKQRRVSPWVFSSIGILFIGFILGGLWWLSPKNPVAVELPARPDEQIGLRFYGVELRGRKQGTPFFTIFADEVEVSRDQRYIEFKTGSKAPTTKPHGEFFNLKDWESLDGDGADNPRSMTWEANQATYDSQLQNLHMQKSVEILTDLQDIIQTDDFLWNKQEQTMTSNTRSKIKTHQETYLEANNLKVETETKNMVLEGRVFIEMKIGDDQVINVEELTTKN